MGSDFAEGRGSEPRGQVMMLQRVNLPATAGEMVVAVDPLNHAEYCRVRDSLKTWRYQLLIKCLRATGLRIGELLRLEGRHYELIGPVYSLLVKRSKTRAKATKQEYERVFLPPPLGVELHNYVQGNRILAGDRVFPITSRAVQYAFTEAGMRAIGRAVHPHEMRKLYEMTLIDGGVPIPAASKLLGHSNIQTTIAHYYDLTTDMRREIGERMPI